MTNARIRSRLAVLLLALGASLTPRFASADVDAPSLGPNDRFPVNQQDPAASIPSPAELEKQPLMAGYLLMDFIDLADAAEKHKRYPEAIKYYQAIAQLVPERATAYSKMCEVYKEVGDTPHALDNCRIALGKPGARVGDAALLVQLLSDNVGGPTPAELNEIDETLAHLQEQKVNPAEIAVIQCGVGVRSSDERRLEECTATLNEKQPEDPKTISYAFTLALLKNDYSGARKALLHARAAGVPAEGLQQMEVGMRKIKITWITRLAGLLAAIGAVALLLKGSRAFKRTGEQPARA